MRAILAALLVPVILFLLIAPVAFLGNQASNTAEGVSLPIETVTITLPKATVYLPRPVETVTRVVESTLPQATKTVFVNQPEKTKTVTVTRFVTPDGDSSTQTRTISASPEDTSQSTPVSTPSENKPKSVEPSGEINQGPLVKFWDAEVPAAVTAGIGLASFVAVLLALYAGYVLGFKDRERDEKRFLVSLSEQLLRRGKHQG